MSTYAFSDVHGVYGLWDAIREHLKPEDKCFFLGDACDREPRGWEIIKEILADPRITYLKGNHEDLICHAVKHPGGEDLYNSINNGGVSTLNDITEDPNAQETLDKLWTLPKYAEYTNKDGVKIFMSHSGSLEIDNPHELLWNRDHFCDTELGGYDMIIHGHTPVPYVQKELKDWNELFEKHGYGVQVPEWDGGAYWYCDNHKVCLDCGAFSTFGIALLDLDTFDEEYFYIPGKAVFVSEDY